MNWNNYWLILILEKWQQVGGVFLQHKIRHQVPLVIMEWRYSETIKADSLNSMSYYIYICITRFAKEIFNEENHIVGWYQWQLQDGI